MFSLERAQGRRTGEVRKEAAGLVRRGGGGGGR